jgi:hypothetical protein
MDLTTALGVLGLTVPFAAAFLMYRLFRFMDSKASPVANQALTAWIDNQEYERVDLGEAVIDAFDHLYGAPLLRWKALRRSVAISLVTVFLYVLWDRSLDCSQNPTRLFLRLGSRP